MCWLCVTGALFFYGLIRCQLTSTQDVIYLEQLYFNKVLLGQYSSTLGNYTGYTEYAKEIADQLNKIPAFLEQERKNEETCRQNTIVFSDVFSKAGDFPHPTWRYKGRRGPLRQMNDFGFHEWNLSHKFSCRQSRRCTGCYVWSYSLDWLLNLPVFFFFCFFWASLMYWTISLFIFAALMLDRSFLVVVQRQVYLHVSLWEYKSFKKYMYVVYYKKNLIRINI